MNTTHVLVRETGEVHSVALFSSQVGGLRWFEGPCGQQGVGYVTDAPVTCEQCADREAQQTKEGDLS
jgi:hypothetical protein